MLVNDSDGNGSGEDIIAKFHGQRDQLMGASSFLFYRFEEGEIMDA